jgi:hypothetical protein
MGADRAELAGGARSAALLPRETPPRVAGARPETKPGTRRCASGD